MLMSKKNKLGAICLSFLIVNLMFIILFDLVGAKIVTLAIKSNNVSEIQLFYITKDNQEFSESNSAKIQSIPDTELTKIRKLIFTRNIEKFRIDFGDETSNFEVSYLSIIDSLFSKKVWDKEYLIKDFTNNNQIEIYKTNNKNLEFQTLGNDGFISGNNITGAKTNQKIIFFEILMFLFLSILFNFREVNRYCIRRCNNKFVVNIRELFKQWVNSIISEFQQIVKFITSNKYIVYITVYFAILAHGVALFYYKIGIDCENSMIKYSQSYNSKAWISQGRFGIGMLKDIFSTGSITVPVYNIFLGLTMLVFFAILSLYIINKYSENKSKLANSSFLIIFISFSQIATYMTFVMYSFEVSIGYFIVALSILFISKFILEKSSVLDIILGLILLMISISIYQSFITLYVLFVCAICLIYNNNNNNKTIEDEIKTIGKYVIALILAVVAYFAVNLILTRSIVNGDGYLGGFLGWKRYDIPTVISIIITSIKSVIFEEKLYGSEILKVAYIVLPVILALTLINKKKRINSIYLMGFMISPFILNIVLGSEQPLRSLVALPAFVGIFSYILIKKIENKNIQKIIFAGIFLIGMYQAQFTSRLYFGDYMRYQQDVQLGNTISEKIEELGIGENHQYPVVYIGLHSSYGKTLILRNEAIGYSFFEWDGGNVHRIKNFMDIIGHSYVSASESDIKAAYEISKNMPTWPSTESVKFENNLIVVNLSHPTDDWLRRYKIKF